MTTHVRAGFLPVPCFKESEGSCPICDLIMPGSPRYSEAYRKAFHPDEFPDSPPPELPTVVAPGPAIPQSASPATVPLAGDLVASLTHRIGADRLAKWVAAKLGTDCRCAERQAKLNALDAKLRDYLRAKDKPPN